MKTTKIFLFLLGVLLAINFATTTNAAKIGLGLHGNKMINQQSCLQQQKSGFVNCPKFGERKIDLTGFQVAITNKDFALFQKVTSGTHLANLINTQEKFIKFIQFQELQKQIRALKQELGFSGNTVKHRQKHLHKKRFEEKKDRKLGRNEKMQKALATNDYGMFQEASKNTPLELQITTKEKFEKFVQMHQAIQNGNKEVADKIAEELGLLRKFFRKKLR